MGLDFNYIAGQTPLDDDDKLGRGCIDYMPELIAAFSFFGSLSNRIASL